MNNKEKRSIKTDLKMSGHLYYTHYMDYGMHSINMLKLVVSRRHIVLQRYTLKQEGRNPIFTS